MLPVFSRDALLSIFLLRIILFGSPSDNAALTTGCSTLSLLHGLSLVLFLELQEERRQHELWQSSEFRRCHSPFAAPRGSTTSVACPLLVAWQDAFPPRSRQSLLQLLAGIPLPVPGRLRLGSSSAFERSARGRRVRTGRGETGQVTYLRLDGNLAHHIDQVQGDLDPRRSFLHLTFGGKSQGENQVTGLGALRNRTLRGTLGRLVSDLEAIAVSTRHGQAL
jgi:hypothetical protein